MNMCVSVVIIDECPKLLHPIPKYKARVVIDQYHLECVFIIIFMFNYSIELPSE